MSGKRPFIKVGHGVNAEEAFDMACFYDVTSLDDVTVMDCKPGPLQSKEGPFVVPNVPIGTTNFLVANTLLNVAPYNNPGFNRAGALQISNNLWLFFGTTYSNFAK